jgi:hypothetical protein
MVDDDSGDFEEIYFDSDDSSSEDYESSPQNKRMRRSGVVSVPPSEASKAGKKVKTSGTQAPLVDQTPISAK